jgi:hypothetical protein
MDTIPEQAQKQRKDRILGQKVIWQKCFQILKGAKLQVAAIAFLGLVLPQLILQAFFDSDGMQTAALLRELVDNLEANPTGFSGIVATAGLYFSSFLAVQFLYLFIFVATYLALVHVSIEWIRGQNTGSIKDAFAQGFKAAFPRGIFILLIYTLVFTIGQVLIFPFILLTALGLMIPVILLVENKSASRSFLDAVTLKYVKHSAFSAWNVLFSLLTIAAIIYTAVIGINVLLDFFYHLDESFGLSRNFWTMSFFSMDYPAVYIIGSAVSTVATAFVVTFLPTLTVVTYFEIVSPRPIDQA